MVTLGFGFGIEEGDIFGECDIGFGGTKLVLSRKGGGSSGFGVSGGFAVGALDVAVGSTTVGVVSASLEATGWFTLPDLAVDIKNNI